METKVIDIQFDEPLYSLVGYDHSGFENNAICESLDRIVEGRTGNSLGCLHYGITSIEDNPIDFSQDFTLHFGLFCGAYDNPFSVYFFVSFDGIDDVLKLDPQTSAGSWVYLTITKQDEILSVYLDGVLKDTYGVTPDMGNIEAVIVDKFFTGETPNLHSQGFQIDNLIAINGKALIQTEIKNEIINYTTKLAYYINGQDFVDLGIRVEHIEGLTDTPESKETKSYDWADQHGTSVDVSQKRFTNRIIEIDCWFTADTREQIIDKAMLIKEAFGRTGMQRFMFKAGARALPFEVSVVESIKFDIKKWVDRRTGIKFKLVLCDTYVVRRVLKKAVVDNNTKSVSVSFNTNGEMFDIYWGDGTFTPNVFGSNTVNNHVYQEIGDYYINISGVVEKITSFTHNATLIWAKLF